MTKIFIGIPTIDGKVNAELMMRMIEWSYKYSSNLIIEYQPFTIPHDHARNILVKKFLDTDATHFLSIDADVVPPVNTITKMLHADKDFVTARIDRFVATDKGYDLAPMMFLYNGTNYDVQYNFTEIDLIRIDGAGAGCFMVKRKVLEKIKQPFKFIYNEDGIIARSEDLYFCDKLRENNFELWADYSINCKHIKQIDVSLLK